MTDYRVLEAAALPPGHMKAVKAGDADVLLVHGPDGIVAVEAKCPHAGAPLEKGALCDGRIVCPWHLGEFALDGALLNPPPLRPLRTYPVRMVGGTVVVGDEPVAAPQAASAPETTARLVALVGAGAAAAAAAGELRRGGFGGRIVAIDPVAGEPIDRTQLSKNALAGKSPTAKARLDAFDGHDVERREATVTKLDAAARELGLSDGSTLRYDAALVATGGRPGRLDVPGAERAFTIRHAADVDAILAAAEGKDHAVVIGSSFIGLEAASALVQHGLTVTVVGTDELPFEKQFGEAAARALVAWHEKHGTQFRLAAEVVSIDDEGVNVRGDAFEERIAADVVIFGVGVSPLLPAEHDLPLATTGGGVAVDATLRAAGATWVAGDVANVDGTRIEHWRVAQAQALVAARAMLGHDVRYDGVPFFWTFHFGKRFGYLGHAERWDQIVTDGSLADLAFLSYFVKDGRVAAVLSCGRDTATAALLGVMALRPTLAGARAAAEAAAPPAA